MSVDVTRAGLCLIEGSGSGKTSVARINQLTPLDSGRESWLDGELLGWREQTRTS